MVTAPPRSLPARSLRTLADALPALYAETSVSELPRAFAALLARLVPGDTHGAVIYDRSRMKRFWHQQPAEPETGLAALLHAGCEGEWTDEQPGEANDNTEGEAPVTAAHLGLRVQHGDVVVCAAVWRAGHGFRPGERALMDALRPHFRQAWANAHCFAQLAASAGVMAPSTTWITEPLEVRYGLTPREGEVLIWVAQGKTNPEVAAILGVQPSTVRTHLERVFAKLGVETRHAAGLRAMEVLGMPAA